MQPRPYASRISVITDPVFYFAAVPAVILVGLAKGGFAGLGALAVPLVALAASPIDGAAIMLPILIVQDVVSLAAYWKKWDRPNLAVLLPSACVGVFAGYLLAAKISHGAFALALGAISFGFALRSLVGAKLPAKTPSLPAGLFWGTAAGFTSMIANAGGPPFQVYVLPQKLPRDTFVGTGVAFFAVVNWVKIPPFLALGALTPQNIATSLVLIPLAIASTWAGVLLVRRMTGERLYTIVYLLMILLGVKLMWDGAVELLAGIWTA